MNKIKALFFRYWHCWFPPKITITSCDFTSDKEGIRIDLDEESDKVKFVNCKFEDWK